LRPFWRNDPANLHGWLDICLAMDSAFPKSCGPDELRRDARTHLLVMASLCWDSGSTPVHVRNMSARGALIEAPVLPRPGNLVMLKRGSLQVGGQIAWAASRQA
jgi:hypothetical protein